MNPSEPGAPATASHLQELLRASQGRWVLDPAGSSAQFQAKQFWGAITPDRGWDDVLQHRSTT